MPVKISGATVSKLINQLEGEMGNLIDNVAEALDIAVTDAAEGMKVVLHSATTPTGEERVASGSGPYAGRYKTGAMHDAIKGTVESPELHRLVGSFGWAGHPPSYYADQEYGFNHPDTGTWVPGMNAFQVTTQAIADFERELARRGFRFS